MKYEVTWLIRIDTPKRSRGEGGRGERGPHGHVIPSRHFNWPWPKSAPNSNWMSNSKIDATSSRDLRFDSFHSAPRRALLIGGIFFQRIRSIRNWTHLASTLLPPPHPPFYPSLLRLYCHRHYFIDTCFYYSFVSSVAHQFITFLRGWRGLVGWRDIYAVTWPPSISAVIGCRHLLIDWPNHPLVIALALGFQTAASAVCFTPATQSLTLPCWIPNAMRSSWKITK